MRNGQGPICLIRHHGGVVRLFLAIAMSCLICNAAHSEVRFEWASIGNAGNSADPHTGDGSVDYVYQISKFEVTNAQYAEFLSSVLPNGNVPLLSPDEGDPISLWADGLIVRKGAPGSYSYEPLVGRESHPANMTFLDSLRFVNWLENGQPTGVVGEATTESGSYDVFRGTTEVRNHGALFVIPTWDEWYKAAYFDPTVDGEYWLFPNRSDSPPVHEAPPGGANSGNFGGLIDVGSYRDSFGFYGTFDQAGNVGEWTEEIYDLSPIRNRRYGQSGLGGTRDSSAVFVREPHFYQGLRVVRLIPEPSSIALASFSLMVIGVLRRPRQATSRGIMLRL